MAPLKEASVGPFGRLRKRLTRLGHRGVQVAPEPRVDAPPASPLVTIRTQPGQPPRHPTPALLARADGPGAADAVAGRFGIDDDDGELLHSMTVSHRDWLEDRAEELGVQRVWLLQSLNDWSWSPGNSFEHQSALCILMNMKMAANPCLENAAVRQAGIRHLRAELSQIDAELAVLAAIRALADLTAD